MLAKFFKSNYSINSPEATLSIKSICFSRKFFNPAENFHLLRQKLVCMYVPAVYEPVKTRYFFFFFEMENIVFLIPLDW